MPQPPCSRSHIIVVVGQVQVALHQIARRARRPHQVLAQRQQHRRYASPSLPVPTRVPLVVRQGEVRHDHGVRRREPAQRRGAQLICEVVDSAKVVHDLPVKRPDETHGAGDDADGGLGVHGRGVPAEHLEHEEHQLPAALLHLLHAARPAAEAGRRCLILRWRRRSRPTRSRSW